MKNEPFITVIRDIRRPFNAWNRIILKAIQCIANVTLAKFCMCSDVLGIFFFVSLDPIKHSGMFLSLRCLKF